MKVVVVVEDGRSKGVASGSHSSTSPLPASPCRQHMPGGGSLNADRGSFTDPRLMSENIYLFLWEITEYEFLLFDRRGRTKGRLSESCQAHGGQGREEQRETAPTRKVSAPSASSSSSSQQPVTQPFALPVSQLLLISRKQRVSQEGSKTTTPS